MAITPKQNKENERQKNKKSIEDKYDPSFKGIDSAHLRDKAEELMKAKKPGDYIIRPGSLGGDSFVVTVKLNNGKYKHLLGEISSKGFEILPTPQLDQDIPISTDLQECIHGIQIQLYAKKEIPLSEETSKEILKTLVQKEAIESSKGRIRKDKESSMIAVGFGATKEEVISSEAAKQRVFDRYEPLLQEKGGTDAVLNELVEHITKLSDNENAAKDKNQRLGFSTNNTALRLLLDPEPPESKYKNALYKGNHDLEARRIAALYWLAASDPNMEISESDLESNNREDLIEGEKTAFILKLAEIRRAHNGDEGHAAENSAVDELSCRSGTVGRILQCPISNMVSKISLNPANGFPMDMQKFITDQFKSLSKDVQDDYFDIFDTKYNLNAGAEPPDGYNKKKLENYNLFIQKLRHPATKEAYFAKISISYGKLITPRRKHVAELMYDQFVNDLAVVNNPNAMPNQFVTNSIEKIVMTRRDTELRERILNDLKHDYLKNRDQSFGELVRLTTKIEQADLSKMTPQEMINFENEIIKERNRIAKERLELDNKFLQDFKSQYKVGLIKELKTIPEFLADSPQADEQVNSITMGKIISQFKGFSETFRRSQDVFDSQVLDYEKELTSLLSEVRNERRKHIKILLDEYVNKSIVFEQGGKELKEIGERSNALLTASEQDQKLLDEEMKVPNIGSYKEKTSQLREKVNNHVEQTTNDFYHYCAQRGLSFSLEEHEIARNEVADKFKVGNIEKHNFKKLDNQIKNLEIAHLKHESYQELLDQGRKEVHNVALKTFNRINDDILSLVEKNPKIDSIEHKQLQILRNARHELRNHVVNPPVKEMNFDKIMKGVKDVNNIAIKMSKEFDKVGYGGYWESLKRTATNFLNKFKSAKQKVAIKSTIKQSDVQAVLRFSQPGQEIEKLKQKALEIERPSYGEDTPKKPKSNG